MPRVQPKLSEPFLGFTKTAEIWNSRACMIGLIGTFIVELVNDIFINHPTNTNKWFQASLYFFFCCTLKSVLFLQVLNKGILQMIGVDVGKGLDLPL